jgi:hypothetical protein
VISVRENAEIAVRDDPVRISAESAERRASRRVWRALVVASDLETCEALLRGEAVPVDRLDAEGLARFVDRETSA